MQPVELFRCKRRAAGAKGSELLIMLADPTAEAATHGAGTVARRPACKEPVEEDLVVSSAPVEAARRRCCGSCGGAAAAATMGRLSAALRRGDLLNAS